MLIYQHTDVAEEKKNPNFCLPTLQKIIQATELESHFLAVACANFDLDFVIVLCPRKIS